MRQASLGAVEQRPIKIVRVIARLNVGGPAIHVVLLTEGLNDARMRSFLVTGQVGPGEADMEYFARQHRVTPVVLPRLGREISWRDDLVALWQLFRILVRERPDVVHTHTAKAGTVGRLAGILARVPIRVHTFHGHVFHGYFGPLKGTVFMWIERLLACFTSRIVAISPQQLDELCDTYRIAPRHKFVVIPLGFGLEPFLQIRRAGREGSSESHGREVVIGMIGRLVPVKNHEMAVRVCERVIRQGRSPGALRLVIVGDGPRRDELELQVQEAGLQSSIVFEGWRSDLPKVYAGLDLVLLTSCNEGTPVALIEAMASGLPFIATRVGGVRDLMVGEPRAVTEPAGRPLYWIYDNGILVDSDDVGGCAAAVADLAADPDRMRWMGEVGREFVRKRYSKERLLDDMRALYDGLVQARS